MSFKRDNKRDTSLCGQCKSKVAKKEQSVNCDACGGCFHCTCVNVSEDLFETLKSAPNGLRWFCEPCDKGVMKLLKDFSTCDERVVKPEIDIKIIKEGLDSQTEHLELIQKSIADLQSTLQTHLEEERPSKVLWSDIVGTQVDKRIGIVQSEVKELHNTIRENKEQASEEKDREARKSNIVIHRLPEGIVNDHNVKKQEDLDFVRALLNDVLAIGCAPEDVKRLVRLGKAGTSARPLLVEFSTPSIRNLVLESLGKLRSADEKYRVLSIVPDRTMKEREVVKKLVEEAKAKQAQDTSGEWLYRVRGTSTSMRVVQLKRRS